MDQETLTKTMRMIAPLAIDTHIVNLSLIADNAFLSLVNSPMPENLRIRNKKEFINNLVNGKELRELNKDETNFKPYINTGKEVYIITKPEAILDIDFLALEHTETFNTLYITYENGLLITKVKVYDKFTEDLRLIIEGKYSRISPEAKTRVRAQSTIYGLALDKNIIIKEIIEEDLEVDLPLNAELLSKIDRDKEVFIVPTTQSKSLWDILR